jgi:hypothetical protein
MSMLMPVLYELHERVTIAMARHNTVGADSEQQRFNLYYEITVLHVIVERRHRCWESDRGILKRSEPYVPVYEGHDVHGLRK